VPPLRQLVCQVGNQVANHQVNHQVNHRVNHQVNQQVSQLDNQLVNHQVNQQVNPLDNQQVNHRFMMRVGLLEDKQLGTNDAIVKLECAKINVLVMELVNSMIIANVILELMENQNGLDLTAHWELVQKILLGLVMLLTPTIYIHGQNVPIKVFVIVLQVNANVLLDMKVSLVRELYVLIIAMIVVLVGQKSIWLQERIVHTIHHGILWNMLDVFVILDIVDHHVIFKNVHQERILLMDMEMRLVVIVLDVVNVIIRMVLANVSLDSLEHVANTRQQSCNVMKMFRFMGY
jgi:hypothetical protein